MPLNNRGEWISHPCHTVKHNECAEEFDDGGGRTKYCDCDCHRNGKKIKITKYEIPLDPHIDVFNVEIGDKKSTRMETIPSEENLRWFLRGIQAGAQMYGEKYVPLVEIPRNAVPLEIKK